MPGRTIDLHTHSLASDGSDRPAALVRKAAAAGLAAVALTDHDSLDGLAAAAAEAELSGIEVIPGIEIAVRDDFGELHLVGLWMPEPSPRMRQALAEFKENRARRNQAMLEALARLGLPLRMEDVRREGGVSIFGRPHLALAMRRRGYVTTRREAFDRYLGWGEKAYVPRELLSAEEGIGLLKGEGATVILAHPCLYPFMTPPRLEATLSRFSAAGLDAVEAYHSSHDAAGTRLCVELAARHSLLLSGGSDYHGLHKEGIVLGRGRGNLRIPYSLLEKLRERRREAGLWV